MPSRWSLSCCRQRASSPVPSITTGCPCTSTPRTVARSGRARFEDGPGTDRQPSRSSSRGRSAGSSSCGLTTCATTRSSSSFGQSTTKTRRPTPIWLAARPTPCASYMEAYMSFTSVTSSSSNAVTSAQRLCRTGVPCIVIGRAVPPSDSGSGTLEISFGGEEGLLQRGQHVRRRLRPEAAVVRLEQLAGHPVQRPRVALLQERAVDRVEDVGLRDRLVHVVGDHPGRGVVPEEV